MPTAKKTEEHHTYEAGNDYADLAAAVRVEAEPWLPSDGDELYGIVLGVETANSEYGEYPLVFVRTPTGEEIAFHAFHTVAKTAVERANPQLGQRIAVKYKGKKEGSGQNGRSDYENYRVVVAPPRDSDTF